MHNTQIRILVKRHVVRVLFETGVAVAVYVVKKYLLRGIGIPASLLAILP